MESVMTDWHLAYYVSERAYCDNYYDIQLFNSWIVSVDSERAAMGIPSIFD